MLAFRVHPSESGADPDTLRRVVAESCRGDVRPRPLDCTGARYLVRDAFADRFQKLAAEHGFRANLEPDRR